MQVIVAHDIPRDDTLRANWNDLVLQQDTPEVFYTYGWAAAAAHSLETGSHPLLMLGYEDGVLRGIAAFAIDDTRRSATFLCGNTADYCDFVSSPLTRRPWITSVFRELAKLNVAQLVLANLPNDSPSLVIVSEFAPVHGFLFFSRHAYVCSRVRLGDSSNRESLKKEVLGKQMYRRKFNAMSRIAPVSLRHNQSWNDIEAVLPAFVRAQVARALTLGRISHLVSAKRRLFLQELARDLSRSGWLVLSEILIGKQAVAWNYGFRFHKSWFWYQPTFSTEHNQFSPGFCLLTKIVAEACDTADLEVVDLGLGNESYKDRFSTEGRPTSHLTLSRRLLLHKREIARERAAQLVKSKPAAERRIRAAFTFTAEVKRNLQRGSATQLAKHIVRRVWGQSFGRDEILFYDWPHHDLQGPVVPANLALIPLNLQLLAEVALCYGEDADTLSYVLRSADRLNAGRSQGFALMTEGNVPVSFSWVGDFEGFPIAELDYTLQSQLSTDGVVIFDCWTPEGVRGKGYFPTSISKVAQTLRNLGKTPWIFAASTNKASLRGIEKAGCEYRWSLQRRTILTVRRKVTKI